MSQLPTSVVVCNLDGRILLYNARARHPVPPLAEGPARSGGAEAIGLGRSIYGVLDRRLVKRYKAVQEALKAAKERRTKRRRRLPGTS